VSQKRKELEEMCEYFYLNSRTNTTKKI